MSQTRIYKFFKTSSSQSPRVSRASNGERKRLSESGDDASKEAKKTRLQLSPGGKENSDRQSPAKEASEPVVDPKENSPRPTESKVVESDAKESSETEKPKRAGQQLLLVTNSGPEADEQLLQRMTSARQATHGLVRDFGPTWYRALQAEFSKPYFVKLAEFVRSERERFTIYPPAEDVFSWTRACRLQDVKVVVLGQDPYHGPRQAHGLCFSVKRPTPPPPSLLNIFQEVGKNFPQDFRPPGHGDLTGWASQGVLLLNAVLTVRQGQPNSHKDKGWETFTDAVVSSLNMRLSGLVFMLWGSYAQKKGARIDKKKHRVITGAHPSPLAANRGGFFGKNFFKEANDYLKSVGREPINWCRLP